MAGNHASQATICEMKPAWSPVSSILENIRAAHPSPTQDAMPSKKQRVSQEKHAPSEKPRSCHPKSHSKQSSRTAILDFKVRMDDEERAKDSSLISGLNVMLKGAVEHQAEADDKNDSIKNGSMKDHAASQAVQGEQSSLTSVTAKSGRGGTIGLGVKPLQLKRLHSKNSLRLDGPDTPSQNVSGSYTHRFLHRVRSDLVKAEMNIPWDAVHPSWKKQRMTWKTAARQAESLKVVLQSVKELRAVIQPSLASSARQELHAIDAHIQHCESECPSMENYSNMIQAVKAFSKALVSSDPVAKPPLDEETDDPMVACPEERLTFLPRSQIPPTEEEEALARYALRVLRQRGHLGEAAIKQCPVEAILQYNTQAADCLLQLLRAEILTLEHFTTRSQDSDQIWRYPQNTGRSQRYQEIEMQ